MAAFTKKIGIIFYFEATNFFGIIFSFEAPNGIIVSLVIIFHGLELLLFDRLIGVLIYNFFLEERSCYLLGHVLSMIMYS